MSPYDPTKYGKNDYRREIFVDDIIRAGIFDLVRSNEIQKFINDGIFEDASDVFEIYNNATSFLPHRCNDSCLVKKADGQLNCRKIDNVSVEQTSHTPESNWRTCHAVC